jgi:hypothetical protein
VRLVLDAGCCESLRVQTFEILGPARQLIQGFQEMFQDIERRSRSAADGGLQLIKACIPDICCLFFPQFQYLPLAHCLRKTQEGQLIVLGCVL